MAKKVGIIRIKGIIGTDKKHVSLQSIKGVVDKTFSKKVGAIALIINSPGGSPVQSELISNYIMKKAADAGIEVYSFIEDIGASGGYWIACSGKEIYAMPSSVVGSIGVISSGFGFHDFIARHGIQRRVYTAGKSKSMLDPFSPEKEADIAMIKSLQEEIHNHFKAWVLSRRQGKIDVNKDDIFSGRVWTGSLATNEGLADGIGDYISVIEQKFGKKVKFIDFHKSKKSLLSSILSSKASIAEDFMHAMEQRNIMSKFGL